MHPCDPRPRRAASAHTVTSLVLVFAVLPACGDDQRKLGFYVASHPPLAVGTTVSVQLESRGTKWAPSGGKSLSVSALKVTGRPDAVSARVDPASTMYIEVTALRPGTSDLTIEASVEGKHFTLTHQITAAVPAAITYNLAEADAPIATGTVLGRGLLYSTRTPVLTDAKGATLYGTVDVRLPGSNTMSDQLYSARAGEVTLPAPPGVIGPTVRFADVEFGVDWRPDTQGVIAGSLFGRVDGVDVLSMALLSASEVVKVITPDRCTVTDFGGLDFNVRPLGGTAGPCRIALHLARTTHGQYSDREIEVPLGALRGGA